MNTIFPEAEIGKVVKTPENGRWKTKTERKICVRYDDCDVVAVGGVRIIWGGEEKK